MNIALIGSAPSSIGLAPYSDPSFQIWGCSPGAYPLVGRVDAWFEIHRWEPPTIGKPDKQVPWFSPEYVEWLRRQKVVWMFDLPVDDLENAALIPHPELRGKYGDYFFTSTLAWMFAMAIEAILEARRKAGNGTPAPSSDTIGLWGVDMAAFEEYGYQRAGCQFFAQAAMAMDIRVIIPPESDLLTPPPLYGLWECSHRAIKHTSRLRELQGRLQTANANLANLQGETAFLRGAIEDMQYHANNWAFEGETRAANFSAFQPSPAPAESPGIDLAGVDLSHES